MHMHYLHHLASRIIGMPLMVQHARLETVLSVVGGRIGVATPVASFDTPDSEEMANQVVVTPNGIAIIPIYGTLAKRVGAVDAVSGLLSYASIEDMILDAATDPAVNAILLDIDSPGGEVGGVFDLATMIREAGANKPIWAVADDAYSGAYLIASASHRIYLPQTGGVGSVGVIAVHVDQSQRDTKEGLAYTAITAGAQKNDFSSHAPLGDDARARLQGEVDRLYGMFVSAVAFNRNMTDAQVRATEAGVFFGNDAVVAGLADQVGTIREVLDDLSATLVQTQTRTTITTTTVTQKEFSMSINPQVAEIATAQPTSGAATTPAVQEDGRVQFQQQANAIVEMCSLANLSHMAGDFIAAGMTDSQVRTKLLAHRASAQTGGPDIQSHILPGDGTTTQESVNLAANPLVLACTKLAQQYVGTGIKR